MMKIIRPSFLLQVSGEPLCPEAGVDLLRTVESLARISHRTEEKRTQDSWKRFLETHVVGHGDWSVTEHASVTAIIRTDRGITHELVRHRLFSFTQESTRFVRNAGEMEFICPTSFLEARGDCFDIWKESVDVAEKVYHELLTRGARPQEARSILPNSLAATIAVTGNLRNWRHFFLMRTSIETHPDFRQFSIPMLEEFKKNIPLLYDDIEPNARQIDNMRKPR